jgi:FtsZ-binding cell division protein ZapB
MANEVPVDPTLVNQAYKNLLSNANDQVAFLQAAATQLQNENNELKAENSELKASNEQLTKASGRQDGVPREEASPAVE